MSETADRETRQRPLSPHIQIYRWTLTMSLSILHRITGMALYAGTLLLAWWLAAAAIGPEAYGFFQETAGGRFGRLVLFGYTWALFHHMFGGIKHLVWDTGRGFDLGTVELLSWLAALLPVALTLATWVLAFGIMGVL